jgi:hypothetical protein
VLTFISCDSFGSLIQVQDSLRSKVKKIVDSVDVNGRSKEEERLLIGEPKGVDNESVMNLLTELKVIHFLSEFNCNLVLLRLFSRLFFVILHFPNLRIEFSGRYLPGASSVVFLSPSSSDFPFSFSQSPRSSEQKK